MGKTISQSQQTDLGGSSGDSINCKGLLPSLEIEWMGHSLQMTQPYILQQNLKYSNQGQEIDSFAIKSDHGIQFVVVHSMHIASLAALFAASLPLISVIAKALQSMICFLNFRVLQSYIIKERLIIKSSYINN